MITALSCLGIGLAFVIAVLLLVLAGVLIAWMLPVRRSPPPDRTDVTDEG